MTKSLAAARTIIDKIWDSHCILGQESGDSLLSVDLHYVNETSFICFQELGRLGRSIRQPGQTFLAMDHTVPTRDRHAGIPDEENRQAVAYLDGLARETGMLYVGLHDPRQGIGHIVASELGLTLPGILIAGDDSHTTTNGAMGALSLGIGLSEVTHVLATQTLWQSPYRTMRVRIDGAMAAGVDAKDLVLALIARIGAGGAIGHIVEFDGGCVASMSMSQRMTLCNMAVEAGARAAIIAPDDTTFAYLQGRPCAPQDQDWERAVAAWRDLRSDDDARFDREVALDAAQIGPTVTWGTSPQDAAPVDAQVPDPSHAPTPQERQRMQTALAYMDLAPGMPLTDIAVDQVFIGSCTNGRLEDLRSAARVARLGKAVVPAVVTPGSSEVKRQAEAEGLDRIFLTAGFEWRDAGCSMCLGMNGDIVAPGLRCASTTNRNFMGRQGPGARTHLMSPAMAAAAALTGHITDVRHLVSADTSPTRRDAP